MTNRANFEVTSNNDPILGIHTTGGATTTTASDTLSVANLQIDHAVFLIHNDIIEMFFVTPVRYVTKGHFH
jgi:hypothetical protein